MSPVIDFDDKLKERDPNAYYETVCRRTSMNMAIAKVEQIRALNLAQEANIKSQEKFVRHINIVGAIAILVGIGCVVYFLY